MVQVGTAMRHRWGRPPPARLGPTAADQPVCVFRPPIQLFERVTDPADLEAICRQERHLCYVWDGTRIATVYEKSVLET